MTATVCAVLCLMAYFAGYSDVAITEAELSDLQSCLPC